MTRKSFTTAGGAGGRTGFLRVCRILRATLWVAASAFRLAERDGAARTGRRPIAGRPNRRAPNKQTVTLREQIIGRSPQDLLKGCLRCSRHCQEAARRLPLQARLTRTAALTRLAHGPSSDH